MYINALIYFSFSYFWEIWEHLQAFYFSTCFCNDNIRNVFKTCWFFWTVFMLMLFKICDLQNGEIKIKVVKNTIKRKFRKYVLLVIFLFKSESKAFEKRKTDFGKTSWFLRMFNSISPILFLVYCTVCSPPI